MTTNAIADETATTAGAMTNAAADLRAQVARTLDAATTVTAIMIAGAAAGARIHIGVAQARRVGATTATGSGAAPDSVKQTIAASGVDLTPVVRSLVARHPADATSASTAAARRIVAAATVNMVARASTAAERA